MMSDFEATDKEELPVQKGEYIEALKDLASRYLLKTVTATKGMWRPVT